MVSRANAECKRRGFWPPTPRRATLEDLPVGKLIFLHEHGDLPSTIREAVRKELNRKWEELDHWRRTQWRRLATGCPRRELR